MPLKKLAAIIFLGAFMLSFAELHQFLKIPVFFQHLNEHKAKNELVTLQSFIQEHYLDKIEMDDDYQQDQQLPFRDTCDLVMNISLSCEALPPSMDIDPLQNLLPQFSMYRDNNRSLIPSFDFFQPPRIT